MVSVFFEKNAFRERKNVFLFRFFNKNVQARWDTTFLMVFGTFDEHLFFDPTPTPTPSTPTRPLLEGPIVHFLYKNPRVLPLMFVKILNFWTPIFLKHFYIFYFVDREISSRNDVFVCYLPLLFFISLKNQGVEKPFPKNHFHFHFLVVEMEMVVKPQIFPVLPDKGVI